jgi:hypothetical protein
MDKKILAVAIAIGTIVITTVLQLIMRGHESSPAVKRLSLITLIAGLIAVIAVSATILTR